MRGEEIGERTRNGCGVVLRRDMAGCRYPHESGCRDFGGEAFGVIDRLKWVVLTPG
jgi:hypothetical protein